MLNLIKKVYVRLLDILNFQRCVLNYIREKYTVIYHNNVKYTFSTPNRLCKYRAVSFSTKEPETLEWIDGFTAGSVFWDIGANVGLYSIYAAKQKECDVYAFEPSVFNLEMLARNVNLNQCASDINILPYAVSDKSGFGLLNMSTTEWGGALSTFDKEYGFDGNKLNKVFEYSIISSSLDDAASKLGLPRPKYIKIDVDGIEHLILQGGQDILSSVSSILVEISVNFDEQASVSKMYLEKAGLSLMDDERYDNGEETVNQIWVRH